MTCGKVWSENLWYGRVKTVCLDSTVLRTALVGMVEMGFQPVPPEPIPHRYAMQFLQIY
jgi:hypothetical protein